MLALLVLMYSSMGIVLPKHMLDVAVTWAILFVAASLVTVVVSLWCVIVWLSAL